MKAIIAKYMGQTNRQPARIAASDGDGNGVIIPYPQQGDQEDKHKQAIFALCDKMGWERCDAFGWLKNGLVGVWTQLKQEEN